MGTRFEVFLRGQDAAHLEAVAVAVIEEVQRLDGVLSRFDPRSEVSRINKHGREDVEKPLRIDRELFALLERCEQGWRLTDGHFDVARGGAFALDVDTCTVRFLSPDTAIDLGAVGKGYALDCGREILARYGVTNGLLQGGTSSVLAVGEDSWPIDLRHPQSSEQVVRRIDLNGRALSCSAARHPGQRRSDVINPHTGEPLTRDAACVVLAANATEAEIFSTGLLAMGIEHATEYLSHHNELQITVGWIDTDGSVSWFEPV